MRYAKIRKMDISNGTGIGVSLFVQGCDFHCKGCFNADTWNFSGGKPFTVKTIHKIIELSKPEYITHLSILGGEPLHPNNFLSVLNLCHYFKSKYPHKEVWVWTGYKMEDLLPSRYLGNIDYLVTGQFKQELQFPNLKFRGSTNQQIYKRNSIENINKADITFTNVTNEISKNYI